MKNKFVVCSVLVFVNCLSAFGQQPANRSESDKNRTVFTILGAGGGFALGLFGGLAAFDDSINSDRKVWTTAILSSAGGAAGGYFLGRTLDKRATKPKSTWLSDDVKTAFLLSRWPAPHDKPYLKFLAPKFNIPIEDSK